MSIKDPLRLEDNGHAVQLGAYPAERESCACQAWPRAGPPFFTRHHRDCPWFDPDTELLYLIDHLGTALAAIESRLATLERACAPALDLERARCRSQPMKEWEVKKYPY